MARNPLDRSARGSPSSELRGERKSVGSSRERGSIKQTGAWVPIGWSSLEERKMYKNILKQYARKMF